MEQRDLIKDQIEQFGRVLGRILSEFLNLKSLGKIDEGIKISNQNLKEELDLDIEKLLKLNREESNEYLNELKFTSTHIYVIIDYLEQMAVQKVETDKPKAKIVLEKILEMFEINDTISNTVPFDRMIRVSKIEALLKQCV